MKAIILSLLIAASVHADTLITNKDGKQTTVVGDMAKLEIVAPVVTPPPVVESPSGTTIPQATQIIDANMNKWTVVAGVIQKNGVPPSFSANVTLLLYFSKTIYQQNSAGGWWSWNGTTWLDSADPRVVVTPPGTKPPVTEPVAGATKGQWQEGAGQNGMTYAYMLPHGYDGSKSYPLMLFIHQLQNDSGIPSQIDPWFNTPDFRSRHPAIVLAPRCTNSSADRNWGGVSQASQSCGDDAISILKSFIAKYPVQTNRVYVTGDSMGGIGSWDMIIRFNDIFAATFILAGATYDHDLNTSAQLLKTFPIWAIHGQNDTQVPLDWERNIKPLVSNMQYEVWNGYGHDVWDDAYPQATHMDWMFAQKKAGTVVTPPTGSFKVQGGQIVGPDGKVFLAKGINIGPQDMGKPILTTFPGINFIRLAVPNDYPNPQTFASFVAQMTAQKVVVEIEDHAWPSPKAYTGDQLKNETNWYQSLATTFKGNPYVWFGSLNEPGDGGSYGDQGPVISAQHLATYNAIRNTGNNTILLFNYFGGGNPGAIGAGFGATPQSYAAMVNVGWDLHFYGWGAKMNTDQNVVNAALRGSPSSGSGITAAQTIQSKDGIMPVIVGEFGDSTDGSNVDANGDQVIAAVLNSGYGFVAWAWDAGGTADQLIKNGQLTEYGKKIAAGIKK